MHDFGHRSSSSYSCHHGVLPLGDALAQVQHLFDSRGWYKDRAAPVSDHIVVLVDGDARHLYRLARIDLDHPVARADHGHAAAIHRVVDPCAAIDVTAQAINDRSSHLLGNRGIGQDVAPAGNPI